MLKSVWLAIASICLWAGAALAMTLPPGFVAEDVAPGAALDTPVGIAFLPGGRLLVAEKRGRVLAIANGVKPASSMWSGEGEVLDNFDRGLHGRSGFERCR